MQVQAVRVSGVRAEAIVEAAVVGVVAEARSRLGTRVAKERKLDGRQFPAFRTAIFSFHKRQAFGLRLRAKSSVEQSRHAILIRQQPLACSQLFHLTGALSMQM